jgi:hypothetical protein
MNNIDKKDLLFIVGVSGKDLKYIHELNPRQLRDWFGTFLNDLIFYGDNDVADFLTMVKSMAFICENSSCSAFIRVRPYDVLRIGIERSINDYMKNYISDKYNIKYTVYYSLSSKFGRISLKTNDEEYEFEEVKQPRTGKKHMLFLDNIFTEYLKKDLTGIRSTYEPAPVA